MDNQEEHDNEIRSQSPSSSSSSPSSPSSSSSSSSSPSHTQSFASSPSTQKDLSPPSSSGTSSSSSSPFSEPSSPVHATVDEASTSLAGETSHSATVDAAASRLNESVPLPTSSMNEDECTVPSSSTREDSDGNSVTSFSMPVDSLSETNQVENSIQSSSIRQDFLGESNAYENCLDERNGVEGSSGRFCLTEGQLSDKNEHNGVFTTTVEHLDDSIAETNGDQDINEHIESTIQEKTECMSETMFSATTNENANAVNHMTLNSNGIRNEGVLTPSILKDHMHMHVNGDKITSEDTIEDITQNQAVQLVDDVKHVAQPSTSYEYTEMDLHMATKNTETTVSCRLEQYNESKIDDSTQKCQSTETFSESSLDAQYGECKPVEEFSIPDGIVTEHIKTYNMNNQHYKKEDNNSKMTGFIEADGATCSTSIQDQNNFDVKKKENGSKMSTFTDCSKYASDPSSQHSSKEENDDTKSGLIDAESIIHSTSTNKAAEHGHALETETSSPLGKVSDPASESVDGSFKKIKYSKSQSLNNSPAPEFMSNGLAETEYNHADTSSDNDGLHRAQTMPTGAFEIVDGMVCQRKQKLLKRSSTDKWKGEKRNAGPKGLEKKKNKILKRICTIQKDGTVEFDVDKTFGLSELFQQDESFDYSQDGEGPRPSDSPPRLHIVMLIVGTRGDVQPFIAIGKRLQAYGHRVRLATHSNFEDFVSKSGLEFFPLGGDPKILAGYMVKNKGFLPSGPSEIRTQRKQLKSIINSLLPACISGYKNEEPFKVQAIIANPPAYGHVHVAEYLKVPLHIFFTMPWTPTSEFAHPLSRVPHGAANKISYQVVDSLIWVGIRGLINDFRRRRLKLRPVYFGPHLSVTNLPTGYIWSPHLVPKPKDWGSKIDVVGFCFLNLSEDYVPPPPLLEWLAAGPPPIYVGFGSLPVEDPDGMTDIILKALNKTSQRGIIGKGWGGIGTKVDLPDTVFLLDNCPHDWLFPHCAAVVHHGGAGTTAAGLRAACPTTIVPFFGDQPFWGERVHEKGVGPAPIPVDQFCLDKLVDAIGFMLNPEVKERAVTLAEAIKGEDGVEGAFNAFHKHLPKELPSKGVVEKPKMFSKACYGHWSCFFD